MSRFVFRVRYRTIDPNQAQQIHGVINALEPSDEDVDGDKDEEDDEDEHEDEDLSRSSGSDAESQGSNEEGMSLGTFHTPRCTYSYCVENTRTYCPCPYYMY